MATNAKDMLKRIKARKEERKRKNVTLSLDEKLYTSVQQHLNGKGVTISELVEEFLRELVER